MVQATECQICGAAVTGQMRFCPSCGKRLHGRSKGLPLAGGVIATVLLLSGLGLQLGLRGSRPAPVHTTASGVSSPHESADSKQGSESSQLAAMRRAVEEAPEDLSRLKVFAGMLGDTLRSNPNAAPELVFEAIDVFGRILQREKDDPTALVLMADVSFDQRAFTKALDFYERYLKVAPDDLGARSRYASTLTFLGRYDDSIRELGSVLAVEPKNFPAMAYLAITYAQKGDPAKAKKIGGEALQVAPSEEARARFSSFVASLDQTTNSSKELAPEGSNVEQRGAQPPKSLGEMSAEQKRVALEQALRANPIAGPKFVRAERTDTRLTLLYRDFPMAQMPPFAKEKFISGVKSAIAQNGLSDVTEVVFSDATSGGMMESVALTTTSGQP
jgi:tetratricopeptide (TPR) repeat protein